MTVSVRTLVLALLLAPGFANAAATAPNQVAPRSEAVLAVYMPPSELTARTYNRTYNVWIEPGQALDESLTQIGKVYFPNMVRVEFDNARPYGLLLDLDPTWELKNGKVHLTMQYNVFGPDGAKLHEGSAVAVAPVKGMSITAAAYSAARQSIQWAMADTLAKVHPDPGTFPATASTAKLNRELLVDRSKPVRTGTGFFINASGQLLTASHVQRDCTVLEATKDGKSFPVTSLAASVLLDVAVLDSGRPTTAALPFRSRKLRQPILNIVLNGQMGE